MASLNCREAAAAGAAPESAPVRTEVTSTHFRGYVRREEYWPEDSPEYRAGCSIENRKRPPPDEVPGDAFDRQRVIPGFDQGLIERQVCLVLGAGGVGQNVALTLGRLGVQKIILVDNDVYEASNLTRQCLGGKDDIGKRKVDVAAQALRAQHGLRSDVEALHLDVVSEWPRVVAAARGATVLFNCIDIGVMWDFCANSLSKHLEIPLVAGQSFGWKYMSEFYTGEPGKMCAFCHESTLSSFQADKHAVQRAGGVLERLSGFAENESMCSIDAASLARFLATDPSFRMQGSPSWNNPIGVVEAALGATSRSKTGLSVASLSEDLLEFLVALHDNVISELLPDKICNRSDIAIIPRPKHASTRYIGSWVCPCLGCAVTMVSQFAAYLTGPCIENQPRDPPVAVTFNLDVGMTSEEQLGYELGALGMPPDKSARTFSSAPSTSACAVCRAARESQLEQCLYVGRQETTVALVTGDVLPQPSGWHVPARGTAEHDEAAKLALSRLKPLAHLGDEYSNAVIPALPAVDPQRDGIAELTLPPELATLPLLKVPQSSEAAQTPSAMRAIRSGVRSALVRARGKWWRLKGCGNNDEGFPAQSVGDKGELNVRGACFKHTADMELYMTGIIADVLAAKSLESANLPAGAYKYAADANWPLPKIDRYCAVFETVGNARLGDHLIAGLIMILPLILPDSGSGFDTLAQALATGRGADSSDLWPTAMVVECGMTTADVAGLLVSELVEVAPPALTQSDGTLAPIEFSSVWDRARASLHDKLGAAKSAAGEKSLLLWLAWRLGWECGATVAALHAAGIAWGTYPDTMGVHCNAHVNNLVVKPPGVGFAHTFLAALDFDMAFTEKTYLPEAISGKSSVLPSSWEELLEFETTMGMATVLAGSDFASTGVGNAVSAAPSHALAEMAMRDTMVAAYQAAIAGATDAHPPQQDMHAAARDVITLALACRVDVNP